MRSALFLALNLGAPAVPSIGFEWDAPAECPSADDVEARVAARVGAPLREGDGARLDVIARVRRDDAGEFAMRVWIIDEQRTHRRDVKDADCGLLADAAATVVAVFVAPKTVPEAPPAPEPEAPKSEATPSQMSWART